MGLCGSKTETVSTTTNTTSKKPQLSQRANKTKNAGKSKKIATESKAKTIGKPGVKLSDEHGTESQNISPAEAARLAAEKRQKKQNDSLTQGELGKKLAKERAKTYSSYRKDE
ncbi:similar to Saccharomyces cerevisiae YGL108C Protein of unknown function, predicted to be palmitoylated [Maudiozyma barnettii]|uniref:YGL108C-like protein n=1 Tax=Maudiozyma barnettii TaxID=61262 RepID=A0A8H2ZJH9_9SACH|nr:hypothetical protein [Kazachstania barnettii]CAB4254257.1 similar to Saccharomyces cerevisiae YGL108C Protein of unknown function, predicted to be palmitoylated [Kazachstania barnettii]CAD1782025.1 similar to Saccharomyces cerevisiae YGL108C Protein of unknown function, predicted to be palmitoylated [Kazachstania barnettii]